MRRAMLSTSDNPYDPFKQYDLWVSYDEKVCGYYSSSYLARIMNVASEQTPEEISRSIEDAVDEICEMAIPLVNPFTGKEACYIKVYDQGVA